MSLSTRTGLSRLWRYTDGPPAADRGRDAARRASPPPRRSLGWTIVGDAIDNGISASDETRLALDVVALHRGRRGGLAARHDDVADARGHRPADRARAAPRPLRPPHLALAALLLAAEGRLDHRPPDERRRRALGRPQPGPDDARRQLADAARGDRRALPARLAPRRSSRSSCSRPGSSSPAGSSGVAHRLRRRANPDRRRHRAARRVGLGHGRRAGVQPRARLPARVRRPQRGEPGLERLRAEALVDLLPRDRVPRRGRDRRRPVRRRAADRRRLAPDRHADRGHRDAAARLPAAAGALRALRPGAGGERRDGEDLDRARRRAGHHRPARRARDRPHRRATSSSTTSSSPTATSRSSTGSRSTCRRAAASRSSASRAAASRRPRS